ncbi:MAG: hotdog fold thioesterase [Wenzhouxiangellaceae bacterium]|nr:hotdog fold thioesterase [Wenzhouxiangellaceae bacterium]
MDEERKREILAGLARQSRGTLMETLGIRYVDAGEGWLEAAMDVDATKHQPMGILHGGATAALAESVGSAASGVMLGDSGRSAVGLELAINHLRPSRDGTLTARAEALHIGRRTHLWQIRVVDERGRLVAASKLTMIVTSGRIDPPVREEG